jgi:predicted DNA-binding transcriptional regulator AlpA
MHQFDSLPDAAIVRVPTVMELFGISAPTVWRWTKSGQLPQPVRVMGVTGWRVGDLRVLLSSLPAKTHTPKGWK